ncbi:hypothetical protein ACTXM3_09425 [Glutamicibacter arilaitensis]|uniref:hypothetical protein n=1 Tax=Glutamicibacter arilaitensis TaxID=256701 RepID=UPI003FD08D6C
MTETPHYELQITPGWGHDFEDDPLALRAEVFVNMPANAEGEYVDDYSTGIRGLTFLSEPFPGTACQFVEGNVEDLKKLSVEAYYYGLAMLQTAQAFDCITHGEGGRCTGVCTTED